MVTVAAALLLLLSPQGEAFSVTSSCRSSLLTTARCSTPRFGRITQLQMSADDEDEEPVGLPPLPSDAAVKKVVAEQQTSSPQKAVVSNNASSSSAVEDEATSYPIDLPSPILLATSMVLAISSIGSLFELTGGTPKLGFGVTAAISAIGLPLSVFLIYAAILKGAAETEEADREFNKPRRL